MRGAPALLLAVAGLATACAGVAGPARVPDPLSAEEHNDLGLAYYTRGEAALAAREFGRAVELRPGFTRARVNLGDARLLLGDVPGAIRAYEAARDQRPGDPAIANNLAWALLQDERRWPEAEPLIRAALAQAPEPRGYYLDTLGVLLLRQDAPGEALAVLRAALDDAALRDPRARALVLAHTAQALARLGDPAGATRCDRAARALLGSGAGEVGASDTVC
ncbi:MAG: tetratricopeptide repeat protein [Candidatus Rokuibacteriota bacterium]